MHKQGEEQNINRKNTLKEGRVCTSFLIMHVLRTTVYKQKLCVTSQRASDEDKERENVVLQYECEWAHREKTV